jgi:6-phosphogluconolactonase
MTAPLTTPAGQVYIQTREESFAFLAQRLNQLAAAGPASIGLSGGSTPKAFYTWAVAQSALSSQAVARLAWHVSDERCVPLASEDSNFGQAARGMLDPLGIAPAQRHPWPVEVPPEVAAEKYNQFWQQHSPQKTFNLCLLGLGDDAHIASLWPQCPLIGQPGLPRFTHTQWPARGWRLTITEAGLSQCDQIVVLVNGANKAAALQQVVHGAWNPRTYPGQVLRQWSSKVTWLIDAAAAAGLGT